VAHKGRPAATPHSSYSKVAKVGTLWALGQQSGSQMLQLGAAVVLARLLTPYDFGIGAAVGFFLRLANKLSSIGFGTALVRLKEVRPEHLSSVFVVALGMSLTMWLALTLSAPALAGLFHNEAIGPALRVAALVYLLLPFGVGQFAEMNRQFRFKQKALVTWTHSVVFVVVSIALALAGYRYWSLIWSALLASVASTLVKIYLGGVQPRLHFSKAAFMEVIPFGAGLQANRILTFCAEYLDSLIVGRLLGLTALGFYDKAFSTVDRVVDRLTAGPGVFLRIFAIIREDPERLRRAYRKSVLGGTLLGLPTFAVLIVLGPELIPFMYGDQWRFSVLPFQILCVAGLFRVSGAYASAVTQAQGRIWLETMRLGVYLTLVVVSAWLGAGWGIVGVAVGIAFANGVMSLSMQTLVCKLTDLRWREVFGAQLPAVSVALILASAMLGAQLAYGSLEPDAPEWHRLVVKLLGAAVAGSCMFLKPPFRAVRALRDEVLIELMPGMIPYLPAWSGVVAADDDPESGARDRTRPGAIPPIPEEHVSRM